jgi:hypothetical protein
MFRAMLRTRDDQRIHFRLADPPTPSPDKYADELMGITGG